MLKQIFSLILVISGSNLMPLCTHASTEHEEPIPFELRGILDLGESISFSLRDLQTESSFWLDPGRVVNGYRVEHFDPLTKTLSMVSEHRTFELRLKESDELAMGVLESRQVAMTPQDTAVNHSQASRRSIRIAPRDSSVAQPSSNTQPGVSTSTASIEDRGSIASLLAAADQPATETTADAPSAPTSNETVDASNSDDSAALTRRLIEDNLVAPRQVVDLNQLSLRR